MRARHDSLGGRGANAAIESLEAQAQRGAQRRLARAKRIFPPDRYRIDEERVNQRAQKMRERGRNGLPPPGPQPGRPLPRQRLAREWVTYLPSKP